MDSPTIIKLPAVIKMTGLGRSSIYSAVARGIFPAQVSLIPGGRSVGWLRHEVERYIEETVAACRGESLSTP
jgi:prophage regulatory protein